jgi:ADP-ribose pyrophosphatase YjhB (NUDIX family)
MCRSVWRRDQGSLSKDTFVQDISTAPSWLAEEDLSWVRERVPLVCVDVVPVRLDHLGQIEKVGLLLRALPDETVSRAIVTGRILRGETVREALWRHLTKDLGPDCNPQLPASITPFTVIEYFPDPHRTGFHDPRQHTVSLAYVVPVKKLFAGAELRAVASEGALANPECLGAFERLADRTGAGASADAGPAPRP